MKKGIENHGFFVKNLITIRHFYKMDQFEFAKALALIEPKRLSEVERGRLYPNEDIVTSLCAYTGASRKILFECEFKVHGMWEHPFGNLHSVTQPENGYKPLL